MNLQKIVTELESKLEKWSTTAVQIERAIKYLKKYGYFKDPGKITISEVIQGVVMFQKLFSLKEDGEIGPKTIRAMAQPRCAVPDFHNQDGVLTMETMAAKWGRKNLSYFIAARDNDLTAQQWDDAIEKGFTQWSDVAGLRFSRTNSQSGANFIISIGSGARHNFDGPGGTLAWAQLPPNNNFNGQLLSRFDTAETWVLTPGQRGIVLLNVACHEIGHLLGLGHSSVSSALMAPYYSPSVSKPVPNDDVTRIVRLYGPSTGSPPPNEPPDEIGTPRLLSATVNKNSVALRWEDNSTGEDEFQVFRNNENQGGVGRGITRATDTNVPDGTHTYKLRARIGSNYSQFSNLIEVRVGTPAPPSPPPTPPTPPSPPSPPETGISINIKGDITNIDIPGYIVTKAG